MDESLHSRLKPIRARQQQSRAWQFAAWGLLAGSLSALAIALVQSYSGGPWSPWLTLAPAIFGTPVGFLIGLTCRRSWRDAALAVDVHYDLKDRAATALEFVGQRDASPVRELAVADALNHLNRIDPRAVVPLAAPRELYFGLATLAVTVAVLWLGSIFSPVRAMPTPPLDVVLAQAERAAEELKELEQFAQREKDPQIEQLVKQLSAAIEELKQPGVDTREALAKLSQMQTALEAHQARHSVSAADAEFQTVGQALALSDALAGVGKALASGQYEQAALQLEQLEPPQLDRQTDKAVREQLDKAARAMSDRGQESLGQATREMSQGLAGDSRRFAEGCKRLAEEARKQGKRKRLHDLLQKQCQCLSECKGECEGDSGSRSQGTGKGKGGKNWGLAESGGALGQRTPPLGAKQREQVTGQQSSDGETETETIDSPEGSQQAKREYRQNYQKYKKLSESVLQSEPIPLGHRQTIRRYFESIRPQEPEIPRPVEALPVERQPD